MPLSCDSRGWWPGRRSSNWNRVRRDNPECPGRRGFAAAEPWKAILIPQQRRHRTSANRFPLKLQKFIRYCVFIIYLFTANYFYYHFQIKLSSNLQQVSFKALFNSLLCFYCHLFTANYYYYHFQIKLFSNLQLKIEFN